MKTKTNVKQLAELKQAMDAAILAYNQYNKEYKVEHNIKGRNKIREIIQLHKEGLDNKQIIEKGYNKNTVNEQIRLYKKGKRTVKTVVNQYLPPKEIKAPKK